MSAPFLEGTSPLVSDRYIITLAVASGQTITMGQVVEINSAWTVDVPSSANSLKVVGIALTGGTAGQYISIVCRGICRAIAGGTIAAGDQVTNSSSNGTVITDNTDKNTSIIGIALSAASSGGTVYVLVW